MNGGPQFREESSWSYSFSVLALRYQPVGEVLPMSEDEFMMWVGNLLDENVISGYDLAGIISVALGPDERAAFVEALEEAFMEVLSKSNTVH